MVPNCKNYNLHEIKLELSYKCNLNCIHCSSEGSSELVQQISLDKAQQTILSGKNLGVNKVSLSGGEPFLWKGIHSLITFINSNGIFQNIYTSGTTPNFNHTINELKSIKNRVSIIVSIYGSSPSIHDSITGVDGSFDKTINSVKTAIQNGINTEVHFVPMMINYLELLPLSNLLTQVGVKKLSILRFVPQGRGATGKFLGLGVTESLLLRNDILKLKNASIDIRTGSPLNYLMLKDQPVCTSGKNKVIVAPDLSIYPCDAFKQVSSDRLFGNDQFSSLEFNDLEVCWENSKYLNIVRDVLNSDFSEPCKSCRYLSKCNSGCLAQRFIVRNTLDMSNDPLCLRNQKLNLGD